MENYFSHITRLWGVISTKQRWIEEGYNDIIHLCVGLTNFHVSYHPICNKADAYHYNLHKNCNYFISEKIAQKRKARLTKYCEQCCRHICLDILASHLPHVHLIVPSTARVFRDECHVGWGMRGALMYKLLSCCFVILFFNRIKFFKFTTAVSKYISKIFFIYYTSLTCSKKEYLVNL